jgi:hypothetical protein
MAAMSPKITLDHLAHAALVYVRQSTLAQVVGNLESQRRLHALAHLAKAAGFTAVITIKVPPVRPICTG